MSYVLIPIDAKGDSFHAIPVDSIVNVKWEKAEEDYVLKIYVSGVLAPVEMRSAEKKDIEEIFNEITNVWHSRSRGAWTRKEGDINHTLLLNHVTSFSHSEGRLVVECGGNRFSFEDKDGYVRESLCEALLR